MWDKKLRTSSSFRPIFNLSIQQPKSCCKMQSFDRSEIAFHISGCLDSPCAIGKKQWVWTCVNWWSNAGIHPVLDHVGSHFSRTALEFSPRIKWSRPKSPAEADKANPASDASKWLWKRITLDALAPNSVQLWDPKRILQKTRVPFLHGTNLFALSICLILRVWESSCACRWCFF